MDQALFALRPLRGFTSGSLCVTGHTLSPGSITVTEFTMTDAIKKCHADETAACCCVDVGTVIDNSDCTAQWSALYADRAAAETALATLTAKARAVESQPCEITSTLHDEAEGIRLEAAFTFSCQAESMIFQLGLR